MKSVRLCTKGSARLRSSLYAGDLHKLLYYLHHVLTMRIYEICYLLLHDDTSFQFTDNCILTFRILIIQPFLTLFLRSAIRRILGRLYR